MCVMISRLIIVRNVSESSRRENQNTHIVFNGFSEDRSVYEIVWKNMVERGRQDIKIWRRRFSCWITKATNTCNM